MDEFIFIYDLLSIGGLGKSKTKWAESPMTSIGGCVKSRKNKNRAISRRRVCQNSLILKKITKP